MKIIPFFGALTLLVPTLGWACTCPPRSLSAREAFIEADVCFIGRVESVRKSPLKSGYNEVRFSILQRFKGFEELRADGGIVYTRIMADECGYPFTKDQDYVVYGKGTPAGYKVDSCSRTGVLDNLLDDIDQLSKLAASQPQEDSGTRLP